MTTKEYLAQAYNLDLLIRSDLEEYCELRTMIVSLQSPSFEENLNTMRNLNAPFMKGLFKLMELEETIRQEIAQYTETCIDIRNLIASVDNSRYRAVLHYRYLNKMTWEDIADKMRVNQSSVRRWHEEAINQIEIPPMSSFEQP